MGKLDVYLRSIERLSAAGAILTSGQAVTLRFPTGDRHATQVTPHDQLVILVREVAPPELLELLDANRPATFEIDSAGTRYLLRVSPRPGVWQVAIEPVNGAPAAVPAQPAAPPRAPSTRAMTPPPVDGDMAIERGQYDGREPSAPTTSGSGLLDQLMAHARAARATDVYLSAGAPAFMRAGGELVLVTDRGAIDAELLSREVGVVAPQEARGAWAQHGSATFTYGDGSGRVRVTLTRDHRGPGAALRLLPAEPPTLERLQLTGQIESWLDDRGLIVVAGPSGTGKTTTLAALVRALGERKRSVIAIEDPIELVHVSPWISQRAVGDHVAGIAAGVAAAMREGADAIVIGAVTSGDSAMAVIDAISGGHLVLTTLVAPGARVAIERMLDRLSAEQRELARALCADALIGMICPVVAHDGRRSFEISARGARS